MKNSLKEKAEKLLIAINNNVVSLWKADLQDTVDCIVLYSEYIQTDLDDDSTGLEYTGIQQQLFDFEKLVKSIPGNLHELKELQSIFEDIMNLGMSLRQNQLNGSDVRSGNEVLKEYLTQL